MIFSTMANRLDEAAQKGLVFYSMSPQVEMVDGSNGRFTIENPAGSGRICYIVDFIFINSLAVMFGDFYRGPNVGLPETEVAKVGVNLSMVADQGVLSFKFDVDEETPLSGGTSFPPMPVPLGWSTLSQDVVWLLPPGTLLGFNIPFTDEGVMAFGLYWFEEFL